MKDKDKRPKSVPASTTNTVDRDIATMTTINRHGSYLNAGFIVTDENENWTEIALQENRSNSNQLQVPGQSADGQSESGEEDGNNQLSNEMGSTARERQKSEGGQSHQSRVKKYLKDQINERIKEGVSKDKRKDTWTAVITSVMSNGKY